MLLGKVTWPSMKKVNHTSQKGLLVPDTKNNNRDNVQKHSLDPVLVFWCVNWRALSLTSEYSENLSTAEALLTVNLVNDKLCLRPPSQNPVFLNSQASSRPAPDKDWIYASWGCPLTTASTVAPNLVTGTTPLTVWTTISQFIHLLILPGYCQFVIII